MDKNLANVKGMKDNGLGKTGQLVERVGGKREKSPVIQGLLEEETPRKPNKRMMDDEGEGVDRFTYGVGSIMDTIELRDYTCTLERRGREQADKLSALVTAMRVDKSTMTKPREEAFRKIRTDLMNVVDELVYAQMMMQGRLLEPRGLQQSVSYRSPNRDSREKPTELACNSWGLSIRRGSRIGDCRDKRINRGRKDGGRRRKRGGRKRSRRRAKRRKLR